MRVFGAFGTIIALYLIAAGSRAEKCGQRQIVAQKIIANGSRAVEGAWPWHGAMYTEESTETSYRCGVTLLTQYFVVTAAHCVHKGGNYVDATKIAIVFGITSLDVLGSESSCQSHCQIHRPVTIIAYPEYSDAYVNIALMELYTNVTFNDYVQPICLWQGDASPEKIISQVGYVVGWGYNENNQLRPDLNEVAMPIVSKKECINDGYTWGQDLPFPTNTFCAGYRKDTTAKVGESGGGLFLQVGNNWVLRGIAIGGQLHFINDDVESNNIFTDVAQCVKWIKKYLKIMTNYAIDADPIDSKDDDGNTPTFDRAEKPQEYNTKDQFNTAAHKCGQSQLIAQKLIFSGYTAQDGAWPWHGALFHRLRDGQTLYACGVTILTEQFVITATHCTIDQQEEQRRLTAERAYIKVGSTNLDSTDRNVQQHNVLRIIRHDEYDAEVFENDIALVQLYTEIIYNKHAQPICLWQGDTSLEKLASQLGYTVGWGYNQDYGLPKDLHEATMPIVTRRECIDSDPNYYRRYIFEHKTFCAGYRNGTTSAPGDSGSGLYLRQADSWVLRGIVSNTKLNPNTLKVDPSSFVVLTDVSYYNEWIKFHVTNPEPIEIG